MKKIIVMLVFLTSMSLAASAKTLMFYGTPFVSGGHGIFCPGDDDWCCTIYTETSQADVNGYGCVQIRFTRPLSEEDPYENEEGAIVNVEVQGQCGE